jgi:hypothetical protein
MKSSMQKSNSWCSNYQAARSCQMISAGEVIVATVLSRSAIRQHLACKASKQRHPGMMCFAQLLLSDMWQQQLVRQLPSSRILPDDSAGCEA